MAHLCDKRTQLGDTVLGKGSIYENVVLGPLKADSFEFSPCSEGVHNLLENEVNTELNASICRTKTNTGKTQ